jgi:TorA maturation chaperone TorD
MNLEKIVVRESNRRDAFKLLAVCYHLPGSNLLNNINDLGHQLRDLCPQAYACINPMKAALNGTEDLEVIKIDYAKLFVGPYQLLAPPYGSVYLENERKVMGDSTLDARNRYGDAGLEISENFRDVPDHIAVELEFMYFLIFQEIEAATHSKMEDFIEYLKKQESFLEDHLGAWVSDFTKNIIANSESQFFKALAQLTKIFIKQDLQRLKAYNDSLVFN